MMASEKGLLRIAQPHGFCSGVARAVETANRILREHPGESIYCLHQIVHNEHIVSDLSRQGMVFVDQVESVPEGALLLFSAHGVSPVVRQTAERRSLRVVDATCPFVARVHALVRRHAEAGELILCIGHRRHDEVMGVAGEAPEHVVIVENESDAESVSLPADRSVSVVTQTTLGTEQVERVIAILKRRFPLLRVPSGVDICYATRDRQYAARQLAPECDRFVVLGSANSSNSQRLVETAQAAGASACLISTIAELQKQDWNPAWTIGVTSGASTPEIFLDEVVAWLRDHVGYQISEVGA